jgi:hypothetical protein
VGSDPGERAIVVVGKKDIQQYAIDRQSEPNRNTKLLWRLRAGRSRTTPVTTRGRTPLVVLIVAAVQAGTTPTWAIVDGTPTADPAFAAGALILRTNRNGDPIAFASGTLITGEWVLTAAHVVADLEAAIEAGRALSISRARATPLHSSSDVPTSIPTTPPRTSA